MKIFGNIGKHIKLFFVENPPPDQFNFSDERGLLSFAPPQLLCSAVNMSSHRKHFTYKHRTSPSEEIGMHLE